jgi:hypothetical protein
MKPGIGADRPQVRAAIDLAVRAEALQLHHAPGRRRPGLAQLGMADQDRERG